MIEPSTYSCSEHSRLSNDIHIITPMRLGKKNFPISRYPLKSQSRFHIDIITLFLLLFRIF